MLIDDIRAERPGITTFDNLVCFEVSDLCRQMESLYRGHWHEPTIGMAARPPYDHMWIEFLKRSHENLPSRRFGMIVNSLPIEPDAQEVRIYDSSLRDQMRQRGVRGKAHEDSALWMLAQIAMNQGMIDPFGDKLEWWSDTNMALLADGISAFFRDERAVRMMIVQVWAEFDWTKRYCGRCIGFIVGTLDQQGVLIEGDDATMNDHPGIGSGRARFAVIPNPPYALIHAKDFTLFEEMQRSFTLTAETVWGVGAYTLALLNCRNIGTMENEPDAKIQRARVRRGKPPFITYKTLRITPMGKQRTSSERGPVQGVLPAHLVRGNFARYTDDAPLFGKYTGQFWRPAHVKGNPERGVVVKDYSVNVAD